MIGCVLKAANGLTCYSQDIEAQQHVNQPEMVQVHIGVISAYDFDWTGSPYIPFRNQRHPHTTLNNTEYLFGWRATPEHNAAAALVLDTAVSIQSTDA